MKYEFEALVNIWGARAFSGWAYSCILARLYVRGFLEKTIALAPAVTFFKIHFVFAMFLSQIHTLIS